MSAPTGYKQVNRFTPEQWNLFRSMMPFLEEGSSLYQQAMGEPGAFEEIEAPARKQFGQMQSNIANRYSGMGIGGRTSSGFGQEQNAAAQQFAESLQAKRQGLSRQALQDLATMAQMLMGQEPYGYMEEEPSFWKSILGSGIEGFGKSFGRNFDPFSWFKRRGGL